MNLQWTKKLGGGKPKYGLVKSGPKRMAIFQAETSEPIREESEAVKKAIESERRRGLAVAAQQTSQALAQDASCFEYDDVYDSMLASRRVGADRDPERKSRYIPKLQEAAKVREVEFDRVYERQLLKEQEADASLPSERYVTAAYKKQLLESRKWDAEDAIRTAAIEKATTAQGTGSMHAFYANLLTKNIATGAKVDANAVSAYTHGSSRNKRILDTSTDLTPMEPPRAQVDSTPLDQEPTIKTEPHNAKDENQQAQPHTEILADEKQDTTALVTAARERYLARKRAKLSAAPISRS